MKLSVKIPALVVSAALASGLGASILAAYAPARGSAIAIGAVIAFVVALIGLAVTSLLIVRPLNALMRAARLLAGGGHSAPMSLRPRGDELGELGRTLALFREFTLERQRWDGERQRDRQAMESARRFRIISDALAVAVVVADIRDGAIRYANPAAQALFGMPKEGPVRALASDYVVSPDEVSTMIAAAQQGRIYKHQTKLRRADQSEFPANLSACSLEFDGVRCVVIGLVDLTEQETAQAEIKRQREAIHQAEKLGALGSLLAGVAHELNNPLSIVVGQATLLEEAGGDPKTLAHSSKIRAAAERCARIVKTFLEMARQRPPSRSAIDINQAVGASLDLVGYGLRTAGIELKTELAPKLPPVWADADQIAQVLTNLIVNAQQAMAEWHGQRRLTVATGLEKAGDAVWIAVCDSGPGVPAAIKSRIFEPFFTTKPVGTGTGIGLSICHGIVAAHHGTIQVDDAPSGGARFMLRLPVGSLETAAATAPAREAPAGGRRVLVVDDEPDLAETLADILVMGGYQVEVAGNGQAALDKIETGRLDAIVSDVRMPGMDGPALYRRLKDSNSDLAKAFVVVTGDTLSPAIREFLEKTGLPSIEKPFVPAEVRRAVGAAIAGALVDRGGQPTPRASADSRP